MEIRTNGICRLENTVGLHLKHLVMPGRHLLGSTELGAGCLLAGLQPTQRAPPGRCGEKGLLSEGNL